METFLHRRAFRNFFRCAARALRRCQPCGFFALATLLTWAPAQADVVARDLGNDLQYFRAQVLPADLPTTEVKPTPLILDLRYTLAETEAATLLDRWLAARATEKTPVFLLLNSETAPALRELLIGRDTRRPHVISIGRITVGNEKPDISIPTTPEEERRAYEAFERAPSVQSLLVENADKPRVDEASIMKARTEAEEEELDVNPLDRITPTDTKPPATPPPPIDRALQRAVHLHQALRALKRLN